MHLCPWTLRCSFPCPVEPWRSGHTPGFPAGRKVQRRFALMRQWHWASFFSLLEALQLPRLIPQSLVVGKMRTGDMRDDLMGVASRNAWTCRVDARAKK